MNFYTVVDLPEAVPVVTTKSSLFFIGSCFAQNIGKRVGDVLMECRTNPYGVVYNPLSLREQILRIVNQTPCSDEEIVGENGRFYSLMASSELIGDSPKALKQAVDHATFAAYDALCSASVVCLTFGTAWIYSLAKSGKVVANCHKMPADVFTRRRMSVEECTTAIRQTIEAIRSVNASARVILTVSPIRHVKDGMHDNQLSKSTLLLACNEQKGEAEYFPSYEIVLDELRDYRFFAEDMVHPSSVASDYLFAKFTSTYFSDEAKAYAAEAAKIAAAMNHKPFFKDETYFKFIAQTLQKATDLASKYGIRNKEHPLAQTIEYLSKRLSSTDQFSKQGAFDILQ